MAAAEGDRDARWDNQPAWAGEVLHPGRRLLLVGEHVLLLQGLAKLLQDQTRAEIRLTVQHHEAEAAVRGWSPEVVILETSDVVTAGGLIARLRRAAETVPLLIIAPAERGQFLAALRAGARGFMGRQSGARELFGCIDAVARGEWGLPRMLLGDLVAEYLVLATAADARATVTVSERERQIVRLLAQGASAHQIGQQLFISESTVRKDIDGLMRKLRVANRMQVVTEAIRLGLIDAG